jgi:hypothetical protein
VIAMLRHSAWPRHPGGPRHTERAWPSHGLNVGVQFVASPDWRPSFLTNGSFLNGASSVARVAGGYRWQRPLGDIVIVRGRSALTVHSEQFPPIARACCGKVTAGLASGPHTHHRDQAGVAERVGGVCQRNCTTHIGQ